MLPFHSCIFPLDSFPKNGSLKMGNINPLNFLSGTKPNSYLDVENYKLIDTEFEYLFYHPVKEYWVFGLQFREKE